MELIVIVIIFAPALNLVAREVRKLRLRGHDDGLSDVEWCTGRRRCAAGGSHKRIPVAGLVDRKARERCYTCDCIDCGCSTQCSVAWICPQGNGNGSRCVGDGDTIGVLNGYLNVGNSC